MTKNLDHESHTTRGFQRKATSVLLENKTNVLVHRRCLTSKCKSIVDSHNDKQGTPHSTSPTTGVVLFRSSRKGPK